MNNNKSQNTQIDLETYKSYAIIMACINMIFIVFDIFVIYRILIVQVPYYPLHITTKSIIAVYYVLPALLGITCIILAIKLLYNVSNCKDNKNYHKCFIYMRNCFIGAISLSLLGIVVMCVAIFFDVSKQLANSNT